MTNLIITETNRRLFEEGIPRIKKCLDQLSDQEIWYRPNENSNSAGNLILHLNGNVRQWIIATLGEQPDIRQRQTEFDERGPIPRKDLIKMLDQLKAETRPVIDRLSSEKLSQKYRVQGFDETGIAILFHVVEHFSYHVGQITYFTKAYKDLDIGYYAGKDLEAKG